MLPKRKMETTPIQNPSPSHSESVNDLRLPQDLIIEILLYLPVKSLLKFKCVSKPWRSLISSRQFIKSHISTSSREGQNYNHQLLFFAKASNLGIKQCSLSAALHDPSTNVSDIEHPAQNKPGLPLCILGIVNGLVCLYGSNDLYLWNPILKQFKHLPSSHPTLGWVVHGLGYDESNDDYKVVKASWAYGEPVHETKVQVYSLRADSWKRIEGFIKGVVPFYNGKYANGKILWTASRSFDSSEKRKIVSLDIVGDKFVELQGPGYEAGALYCGIGLVGGCLSMICHYYRRRADVWVMHKFGVEESWSKVFSLPYDNVHSPAEDYYWKVVCVLGDGEIVLEDRSGLIVYHTKTKDLRNIQLDGFGL